MQKILADKLIKKNFLNYPPNILLRPDDHPAPCPEVDILGPGQPNLSLPNLAQHGGPVVPVPVLPNSMMVLGEAPGNNQMPGAVASVGPLGPAGPVSSLRQIGPLPSQVHAQIEDSNLTQSQPQTQHQSQSQSQPQPQQPMAVTAPPPEAIKPVPVMPQPSQNQSTPQAPQNLPNKSPHKLEDSPKRSEMHSPSSIPPSYHRSPNSHAYSHPSSDHGAKKYNNAVPPGLEPNRSYVDEQNHIVKDLIVHLKKDELVLG